MTPVRILVYGFGYEVVYGTARATVKLKSAASVGTLPDSGGSTAVTAAAALKPVARCGGTAVAVAAVAHTLRFVMRMTTALDTRANATANEAALTGGQENWGMSCQMLRGLMLNSMLVWNTNMTMKTRRLKKNWVVVGDKASSLAGGDNAVCSWTPL